MSEAQSRFVNALRLLSHAVEEELDHHPDPAALLAFQAGELPTAEATAIEEHVAFCRACAELLRDLPVLGEAPPSPTPKPELDAAWARFRAGQDEPRETAGRGNVVAFEKPPARTSMPSWLAAAASIFVALGLGWFLGRQTASGPAVNSEPRVNAPRTSLFPQGVDRADTSEPHPVVLDPDRGGATLVLNPDGAFPAGDYTLRVVDEAGGNRWQSAPVSPSPRGEFTLDLPADFLPRGRYSIELRPRGSTGPPLATYLFEVVLGSG